MISEIVDWNGREVRHEGESYTLKCGVPSSDWSLSTGERIRVEGSVVILSRGETTCALGQVGDFDRYYQINEKGVITRRQR